MVGDSMVGDNASLSPIERLYYLRMSLAKELTVLIASLPLTNENPHAAWKILSDRYENIRLLTSAQISSMKSESSAELKALLNETVNVVSALGALGRPVDGYASFLVHLTVPKLVKQSRREWESRMGSKKVLPAFSELQTFLETRICPVQALEPPGTVELSIAKAQGSSSGQTGSESKPNARVTITLCSARVSGLNRTKSVEPWL